jgi:hypothetical protein
VAKELDLQTKIKKSARTQAGYGQKMSNRFSIGIPDLLIGLPPFIPCYAEVKDLGVVVDKFDRQLDVTPKQYLEMKRFSEPYEEACTPYTPHRRAACVMVGFVHRGHHRLAVLPRDAERISAAYEATVTTWVERQPGGFYDIRALLNGIGIVRMSTFQ